MIDELLTIAVGQGGTLRKRHRHKRATGLIYEHRTACAVYCIRALALARDARHAKHQIGVGMPGEADRGQIEYILSTAAMLVKGTGGHQTCLYPRCSLSASAPQRTSRSAVRPVRPTTADSAYGYGSSRRPRHSRGQHRCTRNHGKSKEGEMASITSTAVERTPMHIMHRASCIVQAASGKRQAPPDARWRRWNREAVRPCRAVQSNRRSPIGTGAGQVWTPVQIPRANSFVLVPYGRCPIGSDCPRAAETQESSSRHAAPLALCGVRGREIFSRVSWGSRPDARFKVQGSTPAGLPAAGPASTCQRLPASTSRPGRSTTQDAGHTVYSSPTAIRLINQLVTLDAVSASLSLPFGSPSPPSSAGSLHRHRSVRPSSISCLGPRASPTLLSISSSSPRPTPRVPRPAARASVAVRVLR